MLSLGALVTRNSPLYTSSFRLGIKQTYLEKRYSVTVNSIVNRCTKNYQLLNSNNAHIDGNRAIQYYNNYRQIRRVHISASSNCLSLFNNEQLEKSSDRDKSTEGIDQIFDKSSSVSSEDFNKVNVNTDQEQSNETPHSRNFHHTKKQNLTLKDIEKMYPNPKVKLHEIYQLVSNNFQKNSINFEFKHANHAEKSKSHSGWICNIKVGWPEDTVFSANASNKTKAAHVASLKCLHSLHSQKKISHGLPVIYDREGMSNIFKRPVRLSISEESLFEVQALIDKYNDNFKHLIEQSQPTLTHFNRKFQEGAVIDPVGKSSPFNRVPHRIQERNEVLKLRYENRMKRGNYINLPIFNYKEKIIDAIKKNRVILIKGDTGCGKTTQVPQYIIDSFIKNNAATDCNMIVSQPRRISAIALAERVANERNEQVGDVIGYQVRLGQVFPNTPAGILFCTTGILLRKLQFNPTLEGCSHVIIDEAHERTINTDMILVLLKRAMKQNPNLKVIVMSATINAELFQNYFNCNVIEIPGRTFPVVMNFLDEINTIGLRSPSRYDLSFADIQKINDGPTTDIVKMGELIAWITRKKPPGAILCFLPGWVEIQLMIKYLEEFSLLPRQKIMIVPLHSKISQYDQKKIFEQPPPDVRKIVLATDIAETGITISDVVYVVDSGIHKQIRWQEKRGISSIDNYWISQANLQQRKGRAGRVKPGISYHFITKDKYHHLDPYPMPEVKRSSLEKTVLDIKTYCDETAIDFLQSMPQPPSLNVIKQAVDELIEIGALDNNENLTSLGKRISLFTVHPKLAKALVYSSIFQCVSPILTIASFMSSDHQVFTQVLKNKTAIRNVKKKYHPTSDHISIVWLYQQWNACNKMSRENAKLFCFQSRLHPERMFTLSKIRALYAEHIVLSHMLKNVNDVDDMNAQINEYAELDELVKGVLLSGLDNVLFHRDFDIRKGVLKRGTSTLIMEDGHRATLTPDSVNFKRCDWASHFLTYVRRTHSEERRTSIIRESSVISPLTLFLFCQARILGYVQTNDGEKDNNINNNDNNNTNYNDTNSDNILFQAKGKRNINLICDKETANALVQYRNIMWNVVRYLIDNYGIDSFENADIIEEINAFKVEMLESLAKMVKDASQSLDTPDEDNACNKRYVD